jgi:hypothetical protein
MAAPGVPCGSVSSRLVALLLRFATHDLDQHDAWRLDTDYGPVYVTIARELPAVIPTAVTAHFPHRCGFLRHAL